jgi:hypothetical protein
MAGSSRLHALIALSVLLLVAMAGPQSTTPSQAASLPPPTCFDKSFTTRSDRSVNGSIRCFAPVVDSYKIVQQPRHGSLHVNQSAETFTYTPHSNYGGTDHFTWKASNSSGDSNTARVDFTVIPRSPTCQKVELSTEQAHNLAVRLDCTGTGPLTYEIVERPTHGSIVNFDARTGKLSYRPDPRYFGRDGFTYRASNAGGNSSIASVRMTMTIPVRCFGRGISTFANDAVASSFPCKGLPPSGQKYVITDRPNHGSLAGVNTSGTPERFVYKPDRRFHGVDSLRYKVRTDRGSSPSVKMPIYVAASRKTVAGRRTGGKTCFGKPATLTVRPSGRRVRGPSGSVVTIGTQRSDVIVGTGGDDWIIGNGGADVICGGGGNDFIYAGKDSLKNDRPSTLIGGPANDSLDGSFADDLIIGDNTGLGADVEGSTGRDRIAGQFGADVAVGDNYATGGFSASGGGDDHLQGQDDDDTMIGDSYALGAGSATGRGNDVFTGSSGKDFEVGDSYSEQGTATGGGNDIISSGPSNDLVVGDSATRTGTAEGYGTDQVYMLDGSDVGYGDNYAVDGATIGGGEDFVGGGYGKDHLFGGPEYDICGGSGGTDTATDCEFTDQVP